VIVPTYNGRGSLPALLDALGRQNTAPNSFEVVVVVDGSEDGTAEFLASVRSPYRLQTLRQPNRGRAAAVNAGLAVASGDLVVLLDDDLEPDPGFLAALLRQHGGESRRGVAAAVRFRMDISTPPFARFWGLRFEDFLSSIEARGRELEWFETYTGAFSVHRSDLLAVGGYSEEFDGYGLEDFELALRLSQVGVELRLTTEAVAYHGYEKDFAQASADARQRGRSALIFVRLHPEVDPRRFEPHDVAPPSLPRRLVRYLLPRMSRVLPFLPGLVRRGVSLAERRRVRRLDFVYTLGLEYFFFLGRLEAGGS
jgi:glycosyltransferase involved in cell wall biosynthesis